MMELEGIRAELKGRIAAIDGRAARTLARDLAAEVDAIRAIAARAGMRPAVAVAGLLDDALARGEQGALVGDWLRLLGDAVECDRTDPAAARAFAAACAVRFVG